MNSNVEKWFVIFGKKMLDFERAVRCADNSKNKFDNQFYEKKNERV